MTIPGYIQLVNRLKSVAFNRKETETCFWLKSVRPIADHYIHGYHLQNKESVCKRDRGIYIKQSGNLHHITSGHLLMEKTRLDPGGGVSSNMPCNFVAKEQ